MPVSTRNPDEILERYAALQRAVEGANATDASRVQLVRVCIDLEKRVEAVQAFHAIQSPIARRACRRELARLGWVPSENDADEIESVLVTEAMLEPSLREKLADALQILFEPRMRPAVLGGTIAFPLLLGVCGVSTSGSSSVLPSLVALVPVLFLLGMCGSVARHVLTRSAQGNDDMDDLPAWGEIVRESPRTLVDVAALATVFLGASTLLAELGMPLYGVLLLVLSALVAPMAFAMRWCGVAWRNLTPMRVATAIRRLNPPYLGVACAVGSLLTPAALVVVLSTDALPYVTLCVAGTLGVVPALMSARMLGLTLYYERERVGGLFELPAETPSR